VETGTNLPCSLFDEQPLGLLKTRIYETHSMSKNEHVHTLVIGGGQAGLAASYCLKKMGSDFVVLDAAPRTGESWRRRWDSLRLFTPAKFNGLPGKPFQRSDFYFPSKNEVADYLEEYVEQFKLPVRHSITVDSLSKTNGSYRVGAGSEQFSAQNVIVATGAYQNPVVPSFAGELDSSIVQLHSDNYTRPDQVPQGAILVVGAGNSGAEISIELTNTGRKVFLAGRDVGRIPADTFGRVLGGRPYWLFLSRVLSVNTPVGRKVRTKALHRGTPLIRLNTNKVVSAGVTRCPRVTGVKGGLPLLEDGTVLDVKGIVWATGYRPDFKWIRLPIFGEHGYPVHDRGEILNVPGLYFVGLHFQTALSSSLLGGVGNDARTVVEKIRASDRKSTARP
jgi:putative flavoprotein involved in K+ transport